MSRIIKNLEKYFLLVVLGVCLMNSRLLAQEAVSPKVQDAKRPTPKVEWVTLPIEVPVERYSDSVVIIPPSTKAKIREAFRKEFEAKTVEIFVKGEKYKSIREYRDKNKDDVSFEPIAKEPDAGQGIKTAEEDLLKGKLAQKPSRPLKDIVEEELDRFSPPEHSSQAVASQGEAGNPQELENMMASYLEEHKHARPVAIDPTKVKTILINSKNPQKNP
ncbi:MAG: hypothetical protein HQL24_01050 [Candidatus Omnitrophica bacterium]|nr:hypothetical protein [Candidatus Omnitrophota bacterium]